MNTPTTVTNGGSFSTILAARAGSIYRRLSLQKLRPMASAPSKAASRASSNSVIPQIFTRVTVGLSSPPPGPAKSKDVLQSETRHWHRRHAFHKSETAATESPFAIPAILHSIGFCSPMRDHLEKSLLR